MSKGLSFLVLVIIVVLGIAAFVLYQQNGKKVPPTGEPALQSPDAPAEPENEGRIEEKLGFTGEGL